MAETSSITRGVKAATARHVEALAATTTLASLEDAFQAAIRELGHGRRLKPIHAALEQRGRAMCDAHPRGAFVPSFGPGRRLQVCGETYRVARGGNSTVVRYAWTYAQDWATGLMHERGLSRTAAHSVWGWWSEYPHRALRVIEEFGAGKHIDPPMNVMIRCCDSSAGPVRCEIGEDSRADRPCGCGGSLFDWGAGHNGWAWFISWRCNRCPAVFTEYVSNRRLMEIRNPALAQRDGGARG